MPGFFVDKRKVFRVEVETAPDPDTGDTSSSWVDLKRFTEGDIQDRNDIATQIRTEQRREEGRKLKGHLKKGGRKRRRGQPTEQASMQYALGALRGFDLVRSIVDWGLTDDDERRVPPVPENIRSLDPFTAQQIHDEIAYLNPSVFPQGNEEEGQGATDEENDGLEYEEDAEDSEEGDQGEYVTSGGEIYGGSSEDDDLYGADEDAPPEAGGVAGEVEEVDEEEDDPTTQTSARRRSQR